MRLYQELAERPMHKFNQEIARSKTQQVQKRVTKPESQLVEKIDEMRSRTSSRFPRSDPGGPRVAVQFVELDTCRPAAVEQVQTEM